MVLKRSEQMLFALLRSSLHNVQPYSFTFEGITGADWKECYSIASHQGVLALAWEGVLLLPKELQPPKPLVLQWGLSVDKYDDELFNGKMKRSNGLDKIISALEASFDFKFHMEDEILYIY